MSLAAASAAEAQPAEGGTRNGILVIGDAQVGKRFLVRRLSTPRHKQTEAEAAAAGSASAAVTAAAVRAHSRIEDFHFVVDTKYYSAQLTFHVLPADVHAQLSGPESAANATDSAIDPVIPSLSAEARGEFGALLAEVQAVLLVFDLSNAASFHAVAARWLPFIEERNPSVLLLVGNETRAASAIVPASDAKLTPAALQQEREELEQLARDWALDHGLEYVSVPHNDALASARTALGTASAVSGASAEELDASAEPVGISRLLEALECNMWSNARMKDRSTLQYMRGAGAGAGMRSSDEHEEEDDEDEEEEDGQSAFADMAEEKQRQDAAAASATTAATASPSDDDSFTGFVSAFPFVASSSSSNSDAPTASSAASTSSPAEASQSASISATPAPAAAVKAKPTAARSASASAFANAFARAISTDDDKPAATPPAASKSKAAPVAPASASADPTSLTAASAAATSALDAPITSEELGALEEHLARAQRDAAASKEPVTNDAEAAERKLEDDMVAFDAVFDKIKDIKAEAMAARAAHKGAATNGAGAAGISDQERRRRAEDTVMRLLQSMGMADELEGDDEEE
jgi:hypothetical protein